MADLRSYLVSKLNRAVSVDEICIATGLSKASVERRLASDFRMDEILTAFSHFGISRAEGLIAMGHLDRADVLAAMQTSGQLVEHASNLQLAEELARRLRG